MIGKAFANNLEKIREDYFGELPKKEIFSLAKLYRDMAVTEVVKLLKNESFDYRLGAVSILDFKARTENISTQEREEIFRAYIDNHNWIDNWGLVDRAAPHVVGRYLYDKDRALLYDLAKSRNPMERRTAIVSTYYFILKNDIEDTFKIAEILVRDSDDYVQKAVGSWVREAGKRNDERLRAFLDQYAKTMPRLSLRYATRKLDKKKSGFYLNHKMHKAP